MDEHDSAIDAWDDRWATPWHPADRAVLLLAISLVSLGSLAVLNLFWDWFFFVVWRVLAALAIVNAGHLVVMAMPRQNWCKKLRAMAMRTILPVLLLSGMPAMAEEDPATAQRHEQQIEAGNRAIDLAARNGWILIQFWAHGVDKREDDKAQRYYHLARNNFFMSMKAMDFFVEP